MTTIAAGDESADFSRVWLEPWQIAVPEDLYRYPDGRVRAMDVNHPAPLSIDGHAYHRRRRARARRNR